MSWSNMQVKKTIDKSKVSFSLLISKGYHIDFGDILFDCVFGNYRIPNLPF
jgi:hypothetical protein